MGKEKPPPPQQQPPPPLPVEGQNHFPVLKPPPGAVSVGTETSRDMAPIPKASKPSWFTPVRLLIVFCVINMLNYIDRGTIASNGVNGSRKVCSENGQCTPGTGIQGTFDLDNFNDGVISSAFMVGLLVASPIFATLTKRVNPWRLIGVGLLVWTAAVVGCGASPSFWFIVICRMLVGVGEASFISLAAPFIDDNAPPAKKTFWLGLFYMCIPTGIAIGYVYGGVVGKYNWRVAFWVEAGLMLPFVILGFTMKPLELKGFSHVGSKKASASAEENALANQSSIPISSKDRSDSWIVMRFLKDMLALVRNIVFVVNVLGYIAYNFVVGAYSYWGPKAGYNIYNMQNADFIFGGITVICGIIGSIVGGVVLDKMTSTINNAFKLLSLTTLVGAIFCFGSFCFKSLIAYVIVFAIGEMLIFATQAPVNFICLHCVTPSLRPLSMAISTVSIHILGDVPSSPLVGLLQDHIHSWRKTALILTSILFLAAVIWAIGIFLRSVDRFNEEESEDPDTKIDNETQGVKKEVKKSETA